MLHKFILITAEWQVNGTPDVKWINQLSQSKLSFQTAKL